MIYFVRSYVADFDARLGKYFNALDRAGLAYRFIGWNKDGSAVRSEPGWRLFARQARLGGGWRNALALLHWNFFVLRVLWQDRKSAMVVHAIDLDSALVCWLFCRLCRRKLIVDIYDCYTAVRSIGGVAGQMIDRLETAVASRADLTLIVNEERLVQHGLSASMPNVLVLENVPAAPPGRIRPPLAHAPWQLGYFGVLEPHHRGLEDLLAVCRDRADVELHIAGYGPLAAEFRRAAETHAHIHYYGAVSSGEGLALMAGMDVIVGMYYLSVPNHAYASPNKYYEHLMLGRGMLTTAGTPPGRWTVAEQSGWALLEGRKPLQDWLDGLDATAVHVAGANASKTWQAKYVSYFQDHYEGAYISRLKALLQEDA